MVLLISMIIMKMVCDFGKQAESVGHQSLTKEAAREVGNSKRRRLGAKHWAMLLVVKRVGNMLVTYIGADINGYFLNLIN